MKYTVAFTTRRGLNQLGRTDWFALRRINVGRSTSLNVLRAQLGRCLATRPVGVRDTAGQGGGEIRLERGQLLERSALGDPEIGLLPALIDLHVEDPGGGQGAAALFERA